MATPLMREDNIYRHYINDLDRIALATSYSTSRTTAYQHESDNSFISLAYGRTVHNMRQRGYQILGTGKAPYPHLNQEMAIIFEDMDTYEKYWCHVSERIFRMWLDEE